MNILTIDTSTRVFSIALIQKGRVVKYRNMKADRILSSAIVPAIEKLLDQAGVSLKRIDCFAAGLGPGSFTSLRVGLSTVKGLAFATAKPIAGVPSLDILAQGVAHLGSSICSVMDARRGMVFFSQYKVNEKRVERVSDYHLAPIEDCLKGLKGEIVLVGDGVSLYRDVIKRKAAKKWQPVFVEDKYCHPQARHILPLIEEKIKTRDFGDPHTLVPLYLYPDDCQIRR